MKNHVMNRREFLLSTATAVGLMALRQAEKDPGLIKDARAELLPKLSDLAPLGKIRRIAIIGADKSGKTCYSHKLICLWKRKIKINRSEYWTWFNPHHTLAIESGPRDCISVFNGDPDRWMDLALMHDVTVLMSREATRHQTALLLSNKHGEASRLFRTNVA